jgi:uncharacterized membrane protein
MYDISLNNQIIKKCFLITFFRIFCLRNLSIFLYFSQIFFIFFILMNRIQKTLIWLIVLWFINALYVNYLTFFVIPVTDSRVVQFCDINDRYSCSDALRSDVTKIFGIPWCTYALFVYPLIGFLVFLTLSTNTPRMYIMVLGWMGVAMNSYILIKEYFADLYCLLCLICGFIILMIAILSTRQWIKMRS